jgi:hypothetical protein
MKKTEIDSLLKKLKASEARVRHWKSEAQRWEGLAESWMKSYQEIKDKYEPESVSFGGPFPIVQGDKIK